MKSEMAKVQQRPWAIQALLALQDAQSKDASRILKGYLWAVFIVYSGDVNRLRGQRVHSPAKTYSPVLGPD
jgi:hypothetical protein